MMPLIAIVGILPLGIGNLGGLQLGTLLIFQFVSQNNVEIVSMSIIFALITIFINSIFGIIFFKSSLSIFKKALLKYEKNKFPFNHSFVIPTINKSPYLENCLNSLKSQKIKSNIIITTAKPFIGIKKIAKKYNAKLIIFKKHKNIANDWNRAISSSKSNYVTIAHQDDVYNRDYLYEILNSLKKKKINHQ